MTQGKLNESAKAPHIHLISASLLNAVYQRLSITHPLKFDQAEFLEAMELVIDEWNQIAEAIYKKLTKE